MQVHRHVEILVFLCSHRCATWPPQHLVRCRSPQMIGSIINLAHKGRIGSPILLRALPTQRPWIPSFLVLDHFLNLLASNVSWKAENAFGHNALTIISKIRLSACNCFHFSPPSRASLAKCIFGVLCISTNPRSKKSGTYPDRSATPSCIESF